MAPTPAPSLAPTITLPPTPAPTLTPTPPVPQNGGGYGGKKLIFSSGIFFVFETSIGCAHSHYLPFSFC